MVTQAEHIPVHLGAMPEAVAAVLAHEPAPGEPWILNDPYAGGTHLPDLTIVTRTELGFAVTRAHHADVGGVRPREPAPGSRTLDEEGVVIPPTRLDDATLDALVAQDAQPGRAARRPPRPARRAPSRREPHRGALRDARRDARRRRDGGAARATPSGSSARPSASSPTAASRASTRSRRPQGAARDPRDGHRRGRLDRRRLRRHRAAARRQPQLPARGHALGLLLRRPLPRPRPTCRPRAAPSSR